MVWIEIKQRKHFGKQKSIAQMTPGNQNAVLSQCPFCPIPSVLKSQEHENHFYLPVAYQIQACSSSESYMGTGNGLSCTSTTLSLRPELRKLRKGQALANFSRRDNSSPQNGEAVDH